MKKLSLIMVFVMIMITTVTTSFASIARGGDDNDFWYIASNTQPIYSILHNRNYAVSGSFLFRTNPKSTRYNYVVLYVSTPPNIFLMSEKNNIKLYLGAMEYNLENYGFEEKNTNGECYKSCIIPSAAVDELYNSISMNRRNVFFLVPLKNGGSFKYVLTEEEASDYQEALRRWFKESFGDEYNP